MKQAPWPPSSAWRGLGRGAAILVAAFLGAVPLGAHPLSVSYSRFELAGPQLDAVVRVPLDDMDLLHQLDADLDDRVTDGEIQSARTRLGDDATRNVIVTQDGAVVPLAPVAVGAWSDSQGQRYVEVALRGRLRSSSRPFDVQVTLLRALYSDHRNLAEAITPSGRREFVFQHGNTWRVEAAARSPLATAAEFVRLGVEHIVTGYDHLLFLLALLLASVSLRDVVAIVTSFTVAHSLSLALATLGLVHPSSRAVEALIALSIAYVGVENVVAQRVRHRWLLTFAFGLVHGLGFAGILREMDLEGRGLALGLVTFNLGVEIGQVAIVALAWPVLRALHRSAFRRQVVVWASAGIALAGLFWFVERVA